MQVFFIRELTKSNLFKRIFNIIEIKQNSILLNSKINPKKTNLKINLIKKITTHLNNNNCKNVIISKKLKEDEMLKKYLLENKIQIINGENLFKYLLDKIIKKVIFENNIKPEICEISIITNYLDSWLEILIENISKKYKMLSIVTDNSILFKNLEKKLFEKEGTIILITNNKKKSLLKSNIIINLELNEDQINKYSIYEKSIIISFKNNIKIHKKRFNGKIINNFEIELMKNSKINKELIIEEYSYYDIIDLAEVYIQNNKKEISNISINILK